MTTTDRPGVKWYQHFWAFVRDYPVSALLRGAGFRYWNPPKSFDEGDKCPVLILPGVYETWHYLRLVAVALNEAGHPVHLVPEFGLNYRSIPRSAEIVWQRLITSDLHGVAIVAHSKGGLIGKQLLAFHDADGRIDRMVAVASPFGGSSMARVGPTPALREFLPEDPSIDALAKERRVDGRIVSIYPSFDPYIPEGSRLDGAAENIEMTVTGHFNILRDKSLPGLVLAEVERLWPTARDVAPQPTN